ATTGGAQTSCLPSQDWNIEMFYKPKPRAKSGFDIQETIIYKDTHARRPRQLRCPGPSGSRSSLLGAESLEKQSGILRERFPICLDAAEAP
ncbi:hypothetical protein M9458_033622, partial [Cirrhinus mrigala]